MSISGEKIIGRYTGKNRGPLMIVIGGMHGNEPAGVDAIHLMLKLLAEEPLNNPDFIFNGRLLGLIGNLRAYYQKKRFIDQDLNRIWTLENIHRIKKTPIVQLGPEEQELLEILKIVEKEIMEYQPEKLVVIDLHTTSSFGGIFTIVPDDQESLQVALEMHAPVVKGMIDGIKGTILHYFNTNNMGIPTVIVSFEAGQHTEKLSVSRSIAAITNCMRTVGCVREEDVENKHDALLIEHSKNLPKISHIISRHAVVNGDQFNMLPDYHNFQLVNKGDFLAKDKHGIIIAKEESMILMPLYQEQGEDGFFLIKKFHED